MNNENESMNCKDKLESHLANSFLQVLIVIFINIIFVAYYKPEIIELFEYPLFKNITITETIAILTIIAFAFGILYFVGVHSRINNEYIFKDVGIFSSKNQIIIVGASFMFPTFLVFILTQQLSSKYEIAEMLFYYLAIMSLSILYFGYITEKRRNITNNLTLKMLAYDESGCKRLEIRNNLKLLDITKMDYRFKDLDENEFLIPSTQVQEIISEPKKNSEADTTKQDTSK